MNHKRLPAVAWICVSLAASVCSAELFQTPVTADSLDRAAFIESVNGTDQPAKSEKGPSQLVWTKTTPPDWAGIKFGEAKTPGMRHLRIGFKAPLEMGSVLTRAGGKLSVLKPGAAYPGDSKDDSQWIAAQRIDKDGRIGDTEADHEEYAMWVLPP